ncbi:transcription factor 20-like [Artemia franciscana]
MHEESQKLYKKSETSEVQSPEIDDRELESLSPCLRKAGRPKGSKNKAPRPDKGRGKGKKRKNKDTRNQPNLSIDPRFGGKVNIPSSSKSKTEKQVEIKGPKINITSRSSSIKSIKFIDQEEENKEKKLVKIIKDQQRLYKANIILTEDKDTVDSSWVCLFCKKLSHEQGLGDLLGPYFVTAPDDDDDDDDNEALQSTGRLASSESKVDSDELETWFHERCLYWAPNIYMLAGKIIGIEVVIRELKNSDCNHCHIEGATIACYHRSCENRSHFPCAVGKWQLMEDTYRCYCPRHLL